jgi:hypothetical protein
MVRHNLQRMADPLAQLLQGLLNHWPITGLQHLNGQNRDILMLEAARVSQHMLLPIGLGYPQHHQAFGRA